MVNIFFVTIFVENRYKIIVNLPKMLCTDKKTVFIYEFSREKYNSDKEYLFHICWHRKILQNLCMIMTIFMFFFFIQLKN